MKLADAAEIGILFDASDPDKVSLVNNFADSLKKQKIRIVMLGFYDTPKRAINFNFAYFNRKDVNWFLEPRGDTVRDFISKKFDVLINAYLEESLPLEYVSALSKSSFRIGMYDAEKTYAYDFMVDVKKERDLKHLLDQYKHYLEMM